MQYLIANLWKIPELTHNTQPHSNARAPEDACLMAAACRDCGQYNFPPKAQCRYCGSPRIRTVQLSGDCKPNPGTWVFGAASPDDGDKPN